MRPRFALGAGVFDGRLRWYVYDNQERRRITEPTFNRQLALDAIRRFEKDISGENLKRVGA